MSGALTFKFPEKGKSLTNSPITWAEAQVMINDYMNHGPDIQSSEGGKLEAIRILGREAAGVLGLSYNGSDEIVLFLGSQDGGHTVSLIMVATRQDGTLKKIDTTQVFDQFSPCPKHCLHYVNPNDRPSAAMNCEADQGSNCQ